MYIYHGSTEIIKQPKYGYGRKHNDYGLGFYCTFDQTLAKEWAVKNNTDGYVNCYNINFDTMSVLDINSNKYNVLHWLTILLQNRTFDIKRPLAKTGKDYLLNNFFIEYEHYDFIHGYRADDSYFSFAQDFLSGAISLRQLSNAMYFGDLGNQIVLKSPKAFSAIEYIGYEIAEASEWYPQSCKRDINARKEYLDSERYSFRDDDIYITDIIRERMNANDSRLQRPIFDKRSSEPCWDDGFFNL